MMSSDHQKNNLRVQFQKDMDNNDLPGIASLLNNNNNDDNNNDNNNLRNQDTEIQNEQEYLLLFEIKYGGRYTKPGQESWSALMFACQQGRSEIARFLLLRIFTKEQKYGENCLKKELSHRCANQWTVLQYAVYNELKGDTLVLLMYFLQRFGLLQAHIVDIQQKLCGCGGGLIRVLTEQHLRADVTSFQVLILVLAFSHNSTGIRLLLPESEAHLSLCDIAQSFQLRDRNTSLKHHFTPPPATTGSSDSKKRKAEEEAAAKQLDSYTMKKSLRLYRDWSPGGHFPNNYSFRRECFERQKILDRQKKEKEEGGCTLQ